MEKKIQKIKKLSQKACKELTDASSLEELNSIATQYIGKKGQLNGYFKLLKDLPPEQKKALGQAINSAVFEVNQLIAEKKTALQESATLSDAQDPDIDVTAPFDINSQKKPDLLSTPGSYHPKIKAAQKISDIMEKLGLTVYESRSLDDDYHNFTSLNMPPSHPAREAWDTFYTEEGFIPAVHTSNMQNRVMRIAKPPIKAAVIGRCFRNENVDACHAHTFYQVEGVYVDKGITVSHMKAIIREYIEAFLEQKLVSKIQPSHFPFVEPGIEYLIEWQAGSEKKWLELIGAGMIHPNVLKEAGIDPEVYSGFAWGFGLGRLALIRQKIDDIRWFYSSDLRFLSQFK